MDKSVEEGVTPPFTLMLMHDAVLERGLSRLLELLKVLDESEERTINETPARNHSDDRTTTTSL